MAEMPETAQNRWPERATDTTLIGKPCGMLFPFLISKLLEYKPFLNSEDSMAVVETERLSRMVASAALGRAISTIAELGIADHIPPASSQPVEKLAEFTGTHERNLYRLLRFTASYDVFRETGDREFEHTSLSALLRTDADGTFQPAAKMFHHIFAGWNGIHHAVKTGESSFENVYGQALFPYVGAHPELAPIFDAGMTAFHGHETQAMLDAYDFSGVKVLADIGGGNGSLLAAVLRRYPEIRGILFDLGHVCGRSRAAMQSHGLSDRCSVLEGSFFDSIPEGADTYLMRHIIHDWTDEQSVQILSNCRKVIPKDGRVLLVEFEVSGPNQPCLGKDADMIMLAFPSGMERTKEEYAALFTRSGFQLTKVTPTKSSVSIFEGSPV
jgi:O-methyltransferase domain